MPTTEMVAMVAVVAALALGAGPSLLALVENAGRLIAAWAAGVYRSVIG